MCFLGKNFLHDTMRTPCNRVIVEFLGGVEPETEPLFSVSDTIHINISLHQVRLATGVSQELEVEFIVVWTLRRHLPPLQKSK